LSGKGFGEERGKSLGWVPKYKLKVATKETIRWYNENEWWWKMSISKSKVSIIILNWNGLEGGRENRETNHL